MENFVWNLRLLRAIILLLPGLWLLAARSAKGLSEEGQALLQFKNNITDGSHQLTNWVATDLLPCNWTGVTCTGSSVTNINLSNFNISGEVPEGVLGKELIKPRSPSDGSFFFTSFQSSSSSVQISSSRNNKLAVDPFFCLWNFCQEVCYYLLSSSSASLKIEYLPSLLSFGVCSCLVIGCTHQELIHKCLIYAFHAVVQLYNCNVVLLSMHSSVHMVFQLKFFSFNQEMQDELHPMMSKSLLRLQCSSSISLSCLAQWASGCCTTLVASSISPFFAFFLPSTVSVWLCCFEYKLQYLLHK